MPPVEVDRNLQIDVVGGRMLICSLLWFQRTLNRSTAPISAAEANISASPESLKSRRGCDTPRVLHQSFKYLWVLCSSHE